jgi:ABC-2 type transport system permease protein
VVDHVLQLKLALLGSSFRPGPTLNRTLAALALALSVAAAIVVLGATVDVANAQHRAGIVIVGAALSVALAITPLTSGLGSAMEPRRFASFPLSPRRLAVSLGAAAAVGVPGVLAILLGVGLESAWSATSTGGAAVVAGVLAAAAIILTSQYLVVVGTQLAVSPAARMLVTAMARAVIVVALAVVVTTVLVVRSG